MNDTSKPNWEMREMMENARVPKDAWRTTLTKEAPLMKPIIDTNFEGGDVHMVAGKRLREFDLNVPLTQARLLFALLAKEATILSGGSGYMTSIFPLIRALGYRRDDQKDSEGFFYDYYEHLFLFDFYDAFDKDALTPQEAWLLSNYIQERRMYSVHTHMFSQVRGEGETVAARYREDFVGFLAQNYTEVRIKLV